MSAFLSINTTNFDQSVIRAARPVLLEFGATWCGPCKRLDPLLEQLGETWKGKVDIAKVDVDESTDLATRFQVMSVPTLILFVQGQEKQRITGLQPLDKLMNRFEPYL